MPDEIIDRATLGNLLATIGDDVSFLGDLMDTFFDDTPQLLATIRRSAEAGQAEELRRAAHSLKSNSANFGALALSVMCRDLEEIGKSGALVNVGERLAQVEAEYARVRAALQAIRAAGW